RVEVMRPAVLVPAPPLAHLGAGAARELQRRLIAGRLDDRVIAGPEEGVIDQEDALLGARGDDHLLGAGPLVQRGDRRPNTLRAGRLGVSAPARQQPLMCVRLKLKQLRDRARLAVAAGEHEPGAVLVARVEALDPERADVHGVYYLL